MIDGKKVLALIPARGKSKGIKDKNIVNLNGRPLITYTIKEAVKCEKMDAVVVTTDSEKIGKIAEEAGACVPFLRPSELSLDTSKTIDAVIHAIGQLKKMGYEFDILVLLQPTSPLRDCNDINGALSLFMEKGEQSVASISQVKDHPLLMREYMEEGKLSPLLSGDTIRAVNGAMGNNSTLRRQDMKPCYRINGSIYINRIAEITKETSFNDNQYGYKMDASHSVDIDEMSDLVLAEYFMGRRDRDEQ